MELFYHLIYLQVLQVQLLKFIYSISDFVTFTLMALYVQFIAMMNS